MQQHEPLTVAVVGSTGHGDYGHDLDLAWQHAPETRLLAVADDNSQGLEQAQNRLGVPGYTDYVEMLDKVKPNILCIATRWIDRRMEMCLAAIERGVHIYLEKPLCQDLQQADQIVQACERNHVLLAMALPTRYSPKLERVKQIIDAQKPLGPLLELRGRGKEDNRGGGEDLWVLGTHVLDMFRFLAGDPLSCFATVTKDGKPIEKKDVVEGAEGIGPLAGDAVHAMFTMPKGVMAYFSSVRKMATSPSKYGLQIFCKAGAMEILEGVMPSAFALEDKAWSPGRGKGEWKPLNSGGIDVAEELTGAEYSQRHTLAIRDLVQAIRTHGMPKTNAVEARWTVEMIAAIFESARTGSSVSFPLKERRNPLTLL